jgi:hypothetical protein
MTRTEKFVEESMNQLDRVSRWLNDRIDSAPSLEDVKDVVNDKSRQTIEATRDRVEELGKWLGDLAEELNVIEPPPESRSKKAAGAAAVGVAAVGGWYFFNPTNGEERRMRMRNYFAGVRDRIMGRLEDEEVFVESNGDLTVVDERKVASIDGASLNS